MAPSRIRPSTLLAFLVLAAGCTGASTPSTTEEAPAPIEIWSPPAPKHDFAKMVDPDHVAHSLPVLHTAGAGLKLAGHTRVGAILPPDYASALTQIDVWNGWAVVAGYHNGPSFVILDVREPTKPKPVGYFPNIGDGNTARFSKDGDYVFFGCQLGVEGSIGKDCGNPSQTRIMSGASGVSVFDVSDKAKPRFVDFLGGMRSHNVQVAFIGGKDDVVTNGVDIIEFDRDAKKLRLVSKLGGTHDATVVKHPITGEWLLYTGTNELAIYNIDDPTSPAEVLAPGSWRDGVGWHEQVAFPELLDGRAVLALGGEEYSGTGAPHGVTIVDITDPAKPAKLAYWEAPFVPKTPWSFYHFSIHEMAAHKDGQLAIGWNHGGAWVLDLSTKARQEKPVLLAAYQPHELPDQRPHGGAQAFVPQVPRVWSVAWDARGYLMLPDMFTGFYVLEPEWGLRPGFDGGA